MEWIASAPQINIKSLILFKSLHNLAHTIPFSLLTLSTSSKTIDQSSNGPCPFEIIAQSSNGPPLFSVVWICTHCLHCLVIIWSPCTYSNFLPDQMNWNFLLCPSSDQPLKWCYGQTPTPVLLKYTEWQLLSSFKKDMLTFPIKPRNSLVTEILSVFITILYVDLIVCLNSIGWRN